MSLRTRVVALIGIVLLAGVMLGSALAIAEARHTLAAELDAAMTGSRQTVLSAFEDLPRSDHAAQDLRHLIETFDGNRHVHAVLTDRAGAVLEASTPPKPVQPGPGWFLGLLGPSPGDIQIPAPAPVSDRVILLHAVGDIDAAAVWAEFRTVLAVLGVAIVGCLILVYLLIDWALRPLHAVSAGFVRVGAGDYQEPLALGGPPDVIVLQRGFNEMIGRLAAMSSRNRALESQLITLQDEERADLARDLHDEIGPHLFAANIDAEVIGQLAAGKTGPDIKNRVNAIQTSVSHMQRLVRDILVRLRPSRATELGLNAAIEDLIVFWAARAPQIELQCRLLSEEDMLSEPLKDTVYRIVQEGLNNAMRHAAASQITVSVTLAGREVLVSVSDNGPATRPPAEGGFGLAGMRERVTSLGGALTIGRAGPAGGWSVIARLPLAAPATANLVEAAS